MNGTFYQGSKPTLLTVNVPALDGGEGGGVRVLQRIKRSQPAAVQKAATRCHSREKALKTLLHQTLRKPVLLNQKRSC